MVMRIRNAPQGRAIDLSSIGINDDDFIGMNKIEACTLLSEKLTYGQTVVFMCRTPNYENFMNVFDWLNIFDELTITKSDYDDLSFRTSNQHNLEVQQIRTYTDIIPNQQAIESPLLRFKMISGEKVEYIIEKATVPFDVPSDTDTVLHDLTGDFAPGDYEISFQEFISYNTTRKKYQLLFESTTHTITIPTVVHEPKDTHEVNPEFSRVFIIGHTGGDINLKITIYHDSGNTLTVHYSDLMIKKL